MLTIERVRCIISGLCVAEPTDLPHSGGVIAD